MAKCAGAYQATLELDFGDTLSETNRAANEMITTAMSGNASQIWRSISINDGDAEFTKARAVGYDQVARDLAVDGPNITLSGLKLNCSIAKRKAWEYYREKGGLF